MDKSNVKYMIVKYGEFHKYMIDKIEIYDYKIYDSIHGLTSPAWSTTAAW